MEDPNEFDSRLTPLEREARRWILVLGGASYVFSIVGMVMGVGTVLHRSAYYVMFWFFVAALASMLLTLPLFYITQVRAPRRRRR